MQRKLFRIEEMAATRPVPHTTRPESKPAAVRDAPAFARELAALRDVLAENTYELALLLNEGKERRMARAAGELGAAVEVMEKSTNKILRSAETIDDNAKMLNTSLQDDYSGRLIHEITDQLTAIYEACNFQDLAGQRISKVTRTLSQIDEVVTRMLARCQDLLGADAAPPTPEPQQGLLNGPRLDGDTGHVSQCEIDAMFG